MLIQKVAEVAWRRSSRIRIFIWASGARARILSAIRAPILPVPRTLAVVILRILLIRPLLVLILRLLILVRSLLVLVLLLILVRSLLILIGLIPIRLILIGPLLILVLPLLVGVHARLILDLARRALLRTRARTILTEEPRPHGRSGTKLSTTLTVETSRGQTEKQDRSGGQTGKQDRSGGRRRRTHSFRVPGPVHESFSRLETNISKNQSPLGLLERASIWSST